jgi:predicted dehydrogenase
MNKTIALLGCGIWGQKILSELISAEASVDVFEPDDGLHGIAKSLGASKCFAKWVDFSTYDGIIIATPSSLHRSHLERTLPLNIPIFVEKPLTTNLADALALATLPTDKLFVMHTWTYHPGILELKEIVSSGKLGQLMGIRSTRANWTSPRKDTDSVWNLATHDITIAKALLGRIPGPVFAIAERYHGVIRAFTGVLGSNPGFLFEVSNRYEKKIREVRLNFEGGIVLFEDDEPKVIKIFYGDSGSNIESMRVEHRHFAQDRALGLQIREFIDYLNGGKPPRNTFNEGLEVVKTIHELVQLSERSA